MNEVVITKDNFMTEVLQSDKPVLIDFWASWCGPCKMLSPVISELAQELDGKVKVGKINVDDEQELAITFGIASIPTLLLFEDGQVIKSSMGFAPKSQIKEEFGF